MALAAITDRNPPSVWRLLLKELVLTVARYLQDKRSTSAAARFGATTHDAVTVVCVSDTHNYEPLLPPGDLLIHAGDLTQDGTLAEIQKLLDWLVRQAHTYKLANAGNHGLLLDPVKAGEVKQSNPENLCWGSVLYIQDSSVTLEFRGGRALLIHGSPWTRKHGD